MKLKVVSSDYTRVLSKDDTIINRLNKGDIVFIVNKSKYDVEYIETFSKFGMGYVWSDNLEDL